MRRWAYLVTALIAAGVAPAVHATSLLDYVGQCVPFAREASGIRIYGDAWTWWGQADGQYARGHRPETGSVIVFAKTARLPLGHVAVVSRVVEKRVLMLTHANWSRQNGQRGHAEQDVTLYDVSPGNDWSRVKVWFKDADGLGGGIYPVYGFIYGRGQAAPELTARAPDYVGALIDAYAPRTGEITRQALICPRSRHVGKRHVPELPGRDARGGHSRQPEGASDPAGSAGP